MSGRASSAEIHRRLNHPVIDADGHWIEFEPVLLDYLDAVGGPAMVDRFRREDYFTGSNSSSHMTIDERRLHRITAPPWWSLPTRNSLDRATAMLPRLLYERLGEMGIDFAIVYPDRALFFPAIRDHELQLAAHRAYNLMAADLFRGLGDRLVPAACIPMHTPSEAIEELNFAAGLGLKVMLLRSLMRRPAQNVAGNTAPAFWPDTLGIDSEYDYDPVWSLCTALRVVPTFHSASQGIGTRVSYSNYVYNHIGHFAAAGEAVCKSLFLGGVTHRFPELKFAFLEGGVGWACILYVDLISHWNRRNVVALEHTNPANLQIEVIANALRQYGSKPLLAHIDQLDALRQVPADSGPVDDFARCGITQPEDIRELFVDRFYFGCEADDPITAWAFRSDLNPGGVKLHAMMGTDIGHFDVREMSDVLANAYQLVERRQLDDDAFCDFVFRNPVRFLGGCNPGFFKGTVIENHAAAVLAELASGRR
jgi:predicted TIM-barrel fold metal-dependent hydrolase